MSWKFWERKPRAVVAATPVQTIAEREQERSFNAWREELYAALADTPLFADMIVTLGNPLELEPEVEPPMHFNPADPLEGPPFRAHRPPVLPSYLLERAR